VHGNVPPQQIMQSRFTDVASCDLLDGLEIGYILREAWHR
jgi:hypothetical protein